MSNDLLRQAVNELYLSKNPNRADWADWLYDNHVLIVAKHAVELAERFSANGELSEAAALLHDIADTAMERNDPQHEAKSLEIARNAMQQCGFQDADIQLVVHDAIKFHSCYGGQSPNSLEGKILATADALAHFKTDFYVYAISVLGKQKSLEEIKKWASEKIERDFNDKIQFEEVRQEARPEYQFFKTLFAK